MQLFYLNESCLMEVTIQSLSPSNSQVEAKWLNNNQGGENNRVVIL